MQYILKWRSGQDPQVSWFIRGIREDGSFYGEIVRQEGNGHGVIQTVTGTMLEVDRERFQQIAGAIAASVRSAPDKTWTGLLASGSVQSPTIILRYSPDDEQSSPPAAEFLKLVAILNPYLEPRSTS